MLYHMAEYKGGGLRPYFTVNGERISRHDFVVLEAKAKRSFNYLTFSRELENGEIRNIQHKTIEV